MHSISEYSMHSRLLDMRWAPRASLAIYHVKCSMHSRNNCLIPFTYGKLLFVGWGNSIINIQGGKVL